MPKVRQRDPNNKIKTKSKKRSGGRKKKSNVSRQVQAAVEQKVKQRKENEASNEYATTTTEQAVVDTTVGAAELTGRAASAVYDKVIRQQSPTPSASSGAEANSVENIGPQEPTIPTEADRRQPPHYTEQGRKLAVHQYADSHYSHNTSSAPVSAPIQANTDVGQGVQSKGKPAIETGPKNLPKSRELPKSKSDVSAVDLGRKYAVQSHIKIQTEQKHIQPEPDKIRTDTTFPGTNASAQSGTSPKVKPVTEPGQINIPKTKETVSPSIDTVPVEMGRKYAVQVYAQSQATKQQASLLPESQPVPQPYSYGNLIPGTEVKPKTKPVSDSVSRLTPKAKDTPTQAPTDSAVEQGRRLAIQNYTKAQSEKALVSNPAPTISPANELHPPNLQPSIRLEIPSELKSSPELADNRTETVPDGESKIKLKSKDSSTPRQKPKSAPKTKSSVESLAPKTRPVEKVSRTPVVLSNSQKAAEMGRRKFMREAQKQMAMQAKKAAKAAADITKKAASAILRAIQATVSILAGIFGGVGLVIILLGILLVGAILASPFGILFANEPAPDAIPLSSAIAQISMEFSTKLNELQEGEYENITIEGEPPEWIEVIAVFACHVAGGDDGVDVMILDEEKVDKLRAVFWDMCVITTEEETEEWTGPTTPTDASTEPTVNLTITIEAKTADDMRLLYSFSESQNDALTDLLAEDEMLNSLVGDLDVSQGDALELLNGLPGEVSETRKAVVRQALTLVGKVNYFWGGKSLVIGWDNRWGQPMEVWAAGSPSTGTIRPYGLDCSGFVDWVFYNVSGGSYVIGHGGGVATQHVYCQDISWDQAQPGDMVFYPDDSHAGIVAGWDDAGNIQIVHCASGMNNVVITGSSGFSTVARPYYYGE